MKKLCNALFLMVAFCLSDHSCLFALETDTHEIINEFIAESRLNGFSLDSYLKTRLGLSKGVEEEFRSSWAALTFETNTAKEWMKKGGKGEDLPPARPEYIRSFNHFHDPLSNDGYGIWDSALEWSQRPVGEQFHGDYSWHDVRDYFYQALTLESSAKRDDAFADTFRGLGQLMHLAEDMSVPEHARNDGHSGQFGFRHFDGKEVV